ncbi:MAG: hypothetical protein KGK03_06615 [Candidatus Omnitrophica bacterium]|nr:hypothetical protein [Candidatus Omnitrophota bacterium]MDE2222725.1 hypothetical protein [Candidatus Omnitrophota bacterium]
MKNKLTRVFNFIFFATLPFMLSGCISGGGGSSSGAAGGASVGITGGGPTGGGIITPGGGDPGPGMASIHDPEPATLFLWAIGIVIMMMYFRFKVSRSCLKQAR